MNQKYLFRTALCTLLTITSSCSNEELVEQQTRSNQITITAPDFIYAEQSKTSFDITNDGAIFTWAQNDTVGIFPLKGHQVDFPMLKGAGTKTAGFDGGSWALKPSATYMAYYPYNFNNKSYNKITVDLDNQIQTENRSTAHIGQYDYMAATAKTPQKGTVTFEFKHLTSLVQLTLTVPKKGLLQYVSLTSPEEIFITEGTIDLSASEPIITSNYKSNYITLQTYGIETATDESIVQLYFMLAPVDLTGKQIKVEFLNNDTTYSGSIDGELLLPGKAYRYNIAAQKVAIEQSTFDVPAEGGHFTTVYHSNIPLFTENPIPNSDDSYTESNFWDGLYSDTSSQDIDANVLVANNQITIDVAPAGFKKDKIKEIPLYNQFGDIISKLIINQNGNPSAAAPLLGLTGIEYWTDVMSEQSRAFSARSSLENHFIKTKEPILSSSQEIDGLYGSLYRIIRKILHMKEGDKKLLTCYQPYLDVYFSLLNYTLIQCWGDVPYFEKPLNIGDADNIARTPIAEIYSSLITKLENAIPFLDEKKNDSFTDANSAFFVSKDVANILLGYILLDQKEYSKAITYLNKVIDNGRYSIEKTTANCHGNNNECILGFDVHKMPEILPCLDYNELLVMAAECHHHLNQDDKANSLLQQIATSKGIQLEGSDVMAHIAKIRIECELPFTIPFIRRNNMGHSVLGITSQYILLWPIPQNEINLNPYMIQNPGY